MMSYPGIDLYLCISDTCRIFVLSQGSETLELFELHEFF